MIRQKSPSVSGVIATCLLVSLALSGESFGGINFIKNDLDAAMKKAAEEKKPLMVDVYATWCGPCKVLDKQTFGDEKVQEFANKHFINVKLDGDRPGSQAFKRKHNVRSYPTVIFLDHTGEELDRMAGVQGPDVFLPNMKDWSEGKNTYRDLRKQYDENPSNLELALKLAEKYSSRFETAKANQLLAKISEADPDNEQGFTDDALYMKALQSVAMRKMHLVKAPLQELLAKYPDSDRRTDAYELLLFYAERAKDTKLLLDTVHAFREAEPESVDANYYFAAYTFQHEKSKLDEALKAINAAIAADSNNMSYHDVKADILVGLNRWDDAKKTLTAAQDLATNPRERAYISKKLELTATLIEKSQGE